MQGALRTAAILGAAGLLAAACAEGPRRFGGARHVVMISLDTTRPDHFGFYGSQRVRTPRLDRLAEEAVVLDDLLTVAPTTLASHASLMTGRHPHSHGVPRNGFVLDPANLTLAEILHSHGFRTVAFVASFALARRFGLDQGFDVYDQRFEQRSGEGGADQDQRRAEAVTDAVLGFLDREGVPRNLFLFVHYFDPHAPYAPPPPFDRMYDPAGADQPVNLRAAAAMCRERPGLPSALARRAANLYAGEISYLDAQVGRLIDGLRSRGVLDDAYLVVTSDHGENLCEHPGYFDHGLTVYQTSIRAVGLVRPPGGGGGTRTSRPLSTIDIMPALLTWLGLPVPEAVEGEPFPLRAAEEAAPARLRYAEASKPWEEVEGGLRWRNARKSRCVVQGRYKLIVTPYLGTEELYDLDADPSEQHNLLEEPTPAAREIAESLRARLAEWDASADPLPSRFEPGRREDTLRRLRGLGYLGGP